MAGVENWETKPFNVVQKIFDEHKDEPHETIVSQIEGYFRQRLCDTAIYKIPSLNHTRVDQIPTGSLVRYRCMVQDVYDPTYWLAQYIVRNTRTQETRLECGWYRDTPHLQPHETVDMDNKENKPVERLGFYCVPIPGEANWVKKEYGKKCVPLPVSHSSCANPKRKIEDGDELAAELWKDSVLGVLYGHEYPEVGSKIHTDSTESGSSNKQKTSTESFPLNFPFPDETGSPCIVRVYSSKVELKTTDVIEVVGILSVDPTFATLGTDANGDDMFDQEELRAHEPPSSLVPRIHALTINKLNHNNPYLPSNASSDLYLSEVEKLMYDSSSIRLELHSILKEALLGDGLAAEYLICHLMAKVYARSDGLPIGNLCLNLSECPKTQGYVPLLNHLISKLTTKSTLLEMTIENMNSWNLVPKKDYTLNLLRAGMLQMSAETQVVIDETSLEQGQLMDTGVRNVQALQNVIKWQKVYYDFKWSSVTIMCDINVLTLSERNSILSNDIQVPMVTENLDDVSSYFIQLFKRRTDEVLMKLRSYLTACKHLNYEVPDVIQKAIQEDFVQTRGINPSEMSIEDFENLLTLTRLLTVSCGLEAPSIEIWMKAKAMEQERKARIKKITNTV